SRDGLCQRPWSSILRYPTGLLTNHQPREGVMLTLCAIALDTVMVLVLAGFAAVVAFNTCQVDAVAWTVFGFTLSALGRAAGPNNAHPQKGGHGHAFPV